MQLEFEQTNSIFLFSYKIAEIFVESITTPHKQHFLSICLGRLLRILVISVSSAKYIFERLKNLLKPRMLDEIRSNIIDKKRRKRHLNLSFNPFEVISSMFSLSGLMPLPLGNIIVTIMLLNVNIILNKKG